MRVIGALAAAATLAAPATAHAARAWTHQAAAPSQAFMADAAMTSLDETVIVWNEGGGPTYAEVRPRDGVDGPDAQLDPGWTYAPQVVTDAAGGASAVWLAYVEGQGYRVRTAERVAGGVFGPATDIANANYLIRSAMNARGDLAVLYEWYNAAFTAKRYYVAVRPAGAAAFLPAQPIAGDIPDGEAWWVGGFAISAEGDVLVGWRDGPSYTGGRAWVARRAAAAPAFGPAQQLSSPGARAGAPVVAFDTQGRAVAAWPESPAGEHAGPVRAAIAQPGLPFGASRQIGPDASVDDAIVAAGGPGGAAVVAWEEYHATSEAAHPDGGIERTGWIGETRAVRANLLAGTFSEAFGVTRDVGSRPIVAMTATGVPAVFYEDFRTYQLRVARGNGAGGFDEPQTITCPRPHGDPRAAFFDTHGNAGLLWRRWSDPPLPAYMLSRDAEADEPRPAGCATLEPTLRITPEVAPPGTIRRLDLSNAVEPGEVGKRFSFDLDDDGTYEISESDDPVVDHVFDRRGRNTVRWLVSTEDGSYGGSADVLVTDPPSAELRAGPEAPRTGEVVTLDASGSRDPDGAIAGYRWDTEGDGTDDFFTTEATTTTSFPTPGDHRVRVTVEDDLGATATAQLVLEVRAGQPGDAVRYGPPALPADPPAVDPRAAALADLTVRAPRRRSARAARRSGIRVVLTARRVMTVTLGLAGGRARTVAVLPNRPTVVRLRAPRAKLRRGARLAVMVEGTARLTVALTR
ncbi:MAG TPA: PKD domain-containing protein [Solirubrobacteraceae bacterium]